MAGGMCSFLPLIRRPGASLAIFCASLICRGRGRSPLLHGEAVGAGVPPPGRVLLCEVPGHGVGLDIAADLLLMGVQAGVGVKARLAPIPLLSHRAGPRVVGAAAGV